jgi:hypothetical protein
MPEPLNRWKPVTSEYQEELEPRKRRSLRDRLLRRPAGKAVKVDAGAAETRAEPSAPAGILGVTWFYVLSSAAYFVSGSVLLSFPLSDPAYKLMRHGHVIVPFPVGQLENVPLVNVLAESFFIMAVVSAAVAVLWMVRSRAARGITVCYAGAWLVRNLLYLFGNRVGFHTGPLAPGARQILLVESCADALIFLYLSTSMRAQKSLRKLRS